MRTKPASEQVLAPVAHGGSSLCSGHLAGKVSEMHGGGVLPSPARERMDRRACWPFGRRAPQRHDKALGQQRSAVPRRDGLAAEPAPTQP